MNDSQTTSEKSVQPDLFKRMVGLFPTGVTVVTTRCPDGRAYGVTVSAFTSVSLEPHLILVCLDNRLSGLENFRPEAPFVVNILAENQREVSNHFATPGSDRSESSGCYSDNRDLPALKESLAWIACRLAATYPGGDHSILLGEVVAVQPGSLFRKASPLVYYRGRYGQVHPDLSKPLELADHKED